MCLNGIDLQRTLSERAAHFDAVITDLWNMGEAATCFIPDRDVPRLIAAYSPLPFIVLSSEAYQVQQYEDAGARGYVLKIDGVRGIVKALEAVLLHEKPIYYSPSIEFIYRISRRERQVLRLAADGLTIIEIARHLQVSEKAVEKYRERMFDKFRTEPDEPMNITKVVARALREGLIR
jgi:DNA-binding NarL/FixJ family response regulator